MVWCGVFCCGDFSLSVGCVVVCVVLCVVVVGCVCGLLRWFVVAVVGVF